MTSANTNPDTALEIGSKTELIAFSMALNGPLVAGAAITLWGDMDDNDTRRTGGAQTERAFRFETVT
ncbi:hypothetical protein GCM10010210_37470 [Pseudonocardia hydrocarbonoxydans]